MTILGTYTIGSLTIEVIDGDLPDITVMIGGNDDNPTWEEYCDSFDKSEQPHLQLVRYAIEQLGWIGETGAAKANETSFRFSDGRVWGYTWRAWGDLMQAIVGKQEGYMAYYM